MSLCQLSIKKEYVHMCTNQQLGLNQNYYKYLLISKCLSIYFHLNFKNITCSPDQTTNYQFSLNKWIIKQSEWVLFVYLYVVALFSKPYYMWTNNLWISEGQFCNLLLDLMSSLRINKCLLKVKWESVLNLTYLISI